MTDPSFYRDQAEQALAQADVAELDNVRDRCLRAAQAFTAMAERYERVATARAAREAAAGPLHKDSLLEHLDESSAHHPAAPAAPAAAAAAG